jgi:hypothetical protein
MGYRTFVDQDGSYWQVWDSQPSKMERRLRGSDRRNHKPFLWTGAERRAGQDRRLTEQRRITLSSGYGAGWLTFESLNEKRRLIPIPQGWEDITQAELRALCERARRVAKNEGANIG